MQVQLQSALVGGGIALLGVIIGATVTHWLTLRRAKEQRTFDKIRDRRKWLINELRAAAQGNEEETRLVVSLLREGGVILQPPPSGENLSTISRSDFAAACVPYGSMILMGDDSAKSVQDIVGGDEVLAYDARTHTFACELAVDVIEGKAKTFIVINGCFLLTPAQKVFCDGMYVRADTLQVGKWLVNEVHRKVVIASLERRDTPKEEPVFSMVLRSGNGYYVRTGEVEQSILIKEGETGKTGL